MLHLYGITVTENFVLLFEGIALTRGGINLYSTREIEPVGDIY